MKLVQSFVLFVVALGLTSTSLAETTADINWLTCQGGSITFDIQVSRPSVGAPITILLIDQEGEFPDIRIAHPSYDTEGACVFNQDFRLCSDTGIISFKVTTDFGTGTEEGRVTCRK